MVTVPLLEGLSGGEKMSKSLGNYVGVDEPPGTMFGKLMSISDELMWRYFELLSFRPLREIERLRQQIAEGRNPRDVKLELAAEITTRFHDAAAAAQAQAEFLALSHKVLPKDLPEIVSAQTGLTANLVSTGAGQQRVGRPAKDRRGGGASERRKGLGCCTAPSRRKQLHPADWAAAVRPGSHREANLKCGKTTFDAPPKNSMTIR